MTEDLITQAIICRRSPQNQQLENVVLNDVLANTPKLSSHLSSSLAAHFILNFCAWACQSSVKVLVPAMKKYGLLFTLLPVAGRGTNVEINQDENDLVSFSCPATVGTPINEAWFEARYAWGANDLTTNIAKFMSTFRTKEYDDWVLTYDEMKAAHYEWKEKYVAPHLNSGDSIFESACGIGLNLYMTLEILNEVKGLDSIQVYGNDVTEISVQKANWLFDQAPPFKAKKGTICQADSTNLTFVPSNSFDLVFTGYISPLMDLFQQGIDLDEAKDQLQFLCQRRAEDGQSEVFSEIAQERQNYFYASWASEMIRIAKPGKSIIFEQVSSPFCDSPTDFGGVSKGWWKSAITEYEWDVDPDSIVIENDKGFPHYKRYHVYMRKNHAAK